MADPHPHPRCTALTELGVQCRRTATLETDPPRCSHHGGSSRRCTATTAAGAPCLNPAVPGTDPPRCGPHGGRIAPGKRVTRCTAFTRTGLPCRQPAIRGTDPPLCPSHAGVRRPCTAFTRTGLPCGHWAVRGSVPPRCAFHGGLDHHCTAITAAGGPCPNPAVRGTEPPRCVSHGGAGRCVGAPPGNTYAEIHGVYTRAALDDPIADLQRRMQSLSEAIDRLDRETETDTFVRWVALYGKLCSRLGSLLRAYQVLEQGQDDALEAAINAALDDAAAILGIDI